MTSQLAQDTLEYVRHCEAHGMRRMTPRALLEELDALGYTLRHSFCYTNSANAPYRWAASSKSIFLKGTNQSFAHVDADRSNLPALQAIRFEALVFNRGRVWEI